MILAASTTYTTSTRQARDFNDPYGELLDRMHMASESSNIM